MALMIKSPDEAQGRAEYRLEGRRSNIGIHILLISSGLSVAPSAVLAQCADVGSSGVGSSCSRARRAFMVVKRRKVNDATTGLELVAQGRHRCDCSK